MKTYQPVRFGKYLLLDKIAVGGMAELYRAKITGEEGFEKLVAVKKVLPHLAGEKDLVNAFVDEARLAAFLQHENIIRIYDFGKMEQEYFIAMEYLFGKNLRVVTEYAKSRKKDAGMDNLLLISAKMCDGLDYAHSLTDYSGNPLNIIHRDISPPNIFITYDGVVKIVDFGVAKAASHNTTTQTGIIKGKLAYMSPEQAEGKPIDNRSDIFAVGAIMYELFTGVRMFEGETMEVLAKVREADFVPPEKIVPQIPGPIFRILHKALAKDPDRRYQSCRDMLQDIEECAFGLGLRLNTRSLAGFMEDVFDKEIAGETAAIREVTRHDFSVPEKSEPSASLGVYEKTVAMAADKEKKREAGENKRLCAACHKPLGKNDTYCPWCDKSVAFPVSQSTSDDPQKLRCPYCKKPVEAEEKFCPWCDASLATEDKKQALLPENGLPSNSPHEVEANLMESAKDLANPYLSAYFNAGKVFSEGAMDFLELAFANNTPEAFLKLRIRVSGKVIIGVLDETLPFPIEPGRSYAYRIAGFQPRWAGKDVLHIAVEGQSERASFFLRGSLPIRVVEKEEQAQNVNVNISAQGPLIVDMEDAFPGAKKSRKLDETLQMTRWVPVELHPDLEKQTKAQQLFPQACVEQDACSMGDALYEMMGNLSPEEVAAATFVGPDRIRWNLVPGTTLLLGRKRSTNHVPAFLFPEDQNEHANVKVSRSHCRIFVRDNQVYVRDTSNNGTFLDGKRLSKNQDVLIKNKSQVGIAGILDFQIDIFTDGSRVVSVVLTRLANKTSEKTILACGPVYLGSDPELPITVSGPVRFLAALYYNPECSDWHLKTISGFSGGSKDLVLKGGKEFFLGKKKYRFDV